MRTEIIDFKTPSKLFELEVRGFVVLNELYAINEFSGIVIMNCNKFVQSVFQRFCTIFYV